MQHSGELTAVAIVFWVFVAVVSIAGMIQDYRKRKLALEPLRIAIEHGQQLSPEIIATLLGREERDKALDPQAAGGRRHHHVCRGSRGCLCLDIPLRGVSALPPGCHGGRRCRGLRRYRTDHRSEESASVTRTLSQNALLGADEVSVVICAMAGDDDAYGELVRRRQGSIRQLFRRLCRDPALADDLAQQTFLQAWRTVKTLKSPAAFGGWLRRLAINTWLQKIRAEKPVISTTDLDELPDTAAQPTLSEQLDLDSALAPCRRMSACASPWRMLSA